MSAKYFLDTNIFVYAFDFANPKKQKRANELIKTALENNTGCISFQVIQEFVNVATRKFAIPLSIPDCTKYLNTVLSPLCEVFVSIELYSRTLDVMERWRFSFYDSLIVASALQAGCSILYSEDLQHQQKIEDLVINNPFKTL